VASGGNTAPTYQIVVHNGTPSIIDTTVRQELPRGMSPTVVSNGGQMTQPTGQTGGTEVSWRLQLPPGGRQTLNTALTQTPAGVPVSAPACAFAGNGDVPYDCATSTWQAGEVKADPVWQRPAALIGGLAVLVLVLVAAVWWWGLRVRRRTARTRRPDNGVARIPGPEADGAVGTAAVHTPVPVGAAPPAGRPPTAGPPTSDRPTAGPPTGEPPAEGPIPPAGIPHTFLSGGSPSAPPRPALPARNRRRTGPPVWLLVGFAVVLIALVATAAAWTATAKVSAIDTGSGQPTSGAWVGRTTTGAIGAQMRDATFEFTVYRVNCGAAAQQPAGPAPAGQRCLATISARNISKESQNWYTASQRAYSANGNWVTVDESATRAANGGHDYFATPLEAGQRLLFPLVFRMPGPNPPTRIELRGTAFSAGVSVDVT
jgi:hypothetical protein